MEKANGALVVIGAGPGIGRAVTTLFASQRYENVALFSRRPDQLAAEKKAVEEAVGRNLNIKTYAVDVADSDALLKALGDAEAELGKAECVFYNAARVLPSKLLSHDVKEIEYDFKINVSALYLVTQRVIPQLLELAKTEASAKPGLIVTSSHLPMEPIPDFFALSLVKAAQRNLVQSLWLTYASQGVHLGVINVAGVVSPDHQTLNPPNIAAQTWKWYAQSKEDPAFEIKISG